MNRRAVWFALLLATSAVPLAASASEPTKQQCVDANGTAQDLRRAGKLLDAREKLALCVSQACPGPVREDCAQRLDEVDRATPTLVFEVKDTKGNDVSAVRVTMDGQLLVQKVGGASIAVDPGEHRFVFEDPDGIAPKTEQAIVVREGDKDRHVRVVLGVAATTGTPSAASAASDSGSSQRTIGLVLGGAGVAGLVVGSVFGLVSRSTYSQALQSECGGSANGCSPQGAQDGQAAHGQAMISTVAFIAGGALLAGGAVLYLTAPKAGSIGVAPTVGTNGAGLSVAGAW